MNEPIGVIGIVCPETRRCSASSRSSRRRSPWAIPWSPFRPSGSPLAATDFYQVLETSDVPAGVVNIVTGRKDALAKTLAEHDDVDAVWYFGAHDGVKAVERARRAT